MSEIPEPLRTLVRSLIYQTDEARKLKEEISELESELAVKSEDSRKK